MASGSNKLVDKYQYNDSQIKSDGFAEIITARHIVLRELFTLKKISITNPKAAAKYHSIVNEMNILKTLGDQPFLFKCHKMLKTSNNLYLVYDFMGNHPTLAELLENGSLNNQDKKKIVALKIFNYLKKLKKEEIVFLEFTPENIQVDDNLEVKFLSLENAVFLNRNITSMAFLNLKMTENIAPELKEFVEECSVSYEKEIKYETFQNKIDKVYLFEFGKILRKWFSEEFYLDEDQSKRKISQASESFESSIRRIIEKLTSEDPYERPTYGEIESLFSNNTNSSKKELYTENPQLRVSKQLKNTLNVNNTNNEIKKSRSAIKTQKLNSPDKNELLSIPTGEDSYDKKSVRSSSEYTDSTSDAKIRPKKSSFANQVESEQSNDDDFKAFVVKVLTRRSLCKLLLSISKVIFQMSLIDWKERIMLSFLLLKKGVLLACSLARFISTGKGDGEELTIKESIRREFSKTNDFFNLSVLIGKFFTYFLDKEMDNAKAIYQTTVGKLRTEFPDLKSLKEYNFEYECISENINEKVLKQLVRKSLIQIINKLQTPVKQTEQVKKTPRMLLNPSDFLSTSIRSQVKIDDFDDTASVRSARTIRTNVEGNSNSSFILENFHSEKILRNISFDNLILIYLMGLILDFESYEKMFFKLISDSDVRFEDQSLLKELRKMEPREITFKLTQVIK